jgi:hypothetical protein
MSAFQNAIGSVLCGGLMLLCKRHLPQIDGALSVPDLKTTAAEGRLVLESWQATFIKQGVP